MTADEAQLSYQFAQSSRPGADTVVFRGLAKTAKDGQAAPKGLEGHLVTRVAMGVDVLARLHQQIQQILIGMRDGRQVKAKS